MLDRLEKQLGKFAIPNLSVYLVLLTMIVSGLALYGPRIGIAPGLGEINALTLDRGEWWNILLYPFRVHVGSGFFGFMSGGNAISLLLFLYIYWLFGSMLESALGTFRFNVFIFFSMFIMVFITLLTPLRIPSGYLELSLFLSCAYLTPNMEILLFFILPIRIKWLALFFVGGFILSKILFVVVGGGPFLLLLEPVFGFANFLVFFGPEFMRRLLRRQSSMVRQARHSRDKSIPFHRCTVCGITEQEDPNMDFRFCVKCDDHEYCSRHLNDHEHIGKGN